MYIYKATNNAKCDYEHHNNVESAFENVKQEYENENDNDTQSSYSIAWTENDSGNYEMWIISPSEYGGYKATPTTFEIIRIEVFN